MRALNLEWSLDKSFSVKLKVMKKILLLFACTSVLLISCSKSEDDPTKTTNAVIGKWLKIEETVPGPADGAIWIPAANPFIIIFNEDGSLGGDRPSFYAYQLSKADSIQLKSRDSLSGEKWYRYQIEVANGHTDLLLTNTAVTRFPQTERLRKQ